ncbi:MULTISPECIES: type I polyketide synthase [Actinosynnema]|uniref:type I polyketide synthase n=1 Tax=Actinosynnema TaxID=40566 RepID=UPI0020A477AB|nr:type I polyketide synthase [Actinosynnema pretiosum]MCP2097822.1 Acyl transferase domain-containing protein [Actinosynnema pretiosum]
MGNVEPIAIIGMAAKFPGAKNITEFWENLDAGRTCITELSDEELLANGERPDRMAKPNYVRRRPVLDDEGELDAELFAMTPKDAELRDPQQRMFLETSHAVLEHAGYDPARFDGRIGVYAGTNVNRYRIDHVEEVPGLIATLGWTAIEITNAPDYVSTFVSYKLGLRGPSMTVQTACSTSLVAMHIASNALRVGECEMAIAGGSDIETPFHRGYPYLPGGMLASDGLPRPFDGKATGTNFGSGVGAVLLKPLSAAIRDRDTIHAVILSSSINNDGDRKAGFTAPSVDGQSDCVTEALRLGGVDPRSIGYVEAHGTGTVVGDPIEVAALTDAYRRASGTDLTTPYCAIGSVKSNVGHLGQAAGVAGVIKAVLALRHERIPPTINVSEPNPEIDWATSPFYLATEPVPWPRVDGSPRRCGISSFGIGGTNAHLILQEPPVGAAPRCASRPTGQTGQTGQVEAILWSALDDTADDALRERLADHFAGLPEREFADAAHTLRVGRTALPRRGAVLASSAADAAEALRDHGRIFRCDKVDRRLVFAFPGQGAQSPRMLRGLYEDEALFREGCDAAFDQLEPLLGRDLRKLWLTASTTEELTPTEVAQPLLYVLEYTLAHCLMHWGITPDVLVGHSLGELVAAAVAGTFGFADGLTVIAARSKFMAEAPPGGMLAVSAAEDTVLDAVDDLIGAELAVATTNNSRQTVLSGSHEALAEAGGRLEGRKISCQPVRTAHAYHSPSMRESADKLHEVLGGVRLQEPRMPVVSATTGGPISPEQACSPAFWSEQLVAPVRFDRAVRALVASGPFTALEVGPGRTLYSLLKPNPQVRSSGSVVLATAPKPKGDVTDQAALTEALATLWAHGQPVGYWESEAFAERRRVAVPGYPYQRKLYWIERGGGAPATPAALAQAPIEAHRTPERHTAPEDPDTWTLSHLTWRRHDTVRLNRNGRDAGGLTALALLPAAQDTAATVSAAFQRASYRTVRVHPHDVPGATWVLDAASGDEWAALCAELERRGTVPDVIAHCLLAGDDAPTGTAALDAVRGLLATARTAASLHRRHRKSITVLVLTRSGVDVTGDERVNPVAAMANAFVRSAEREIPGVRWGCLDIGHNTPESALSAELAEPTRPLVALRGSARWLPRLDAEPVLGRADRPLLRHSGTYLVTGGLGGIGLVVAQALSESGLRPRIALLSRTGLPEADSARGRQVGAALDAMQNAGAETLVVTGDVADLASLRAAVAEVEQRFGQVAGVVHSAGLPGGGLIERRTADEVERVLGPKVAGTLNLEEVFSDRLGLDFLVLFSSQAALSGLYGSADYAAANAFLDAHARQASGRERLTLSVQWPGWAEVGMAAASAVSLGVLTGVTSADRVVDTGGLHAEYRRVVTPGVDWEFDEHQFLGRRILPGAALLDMVLSAVRRTGVHSQDYPVRFQDAMFLVPAPGDHAVEFRVVLTPVGDMHRFRVESRPAAPGDGGWAEHATGLVAAGGTPPEAVDPDDLRARFPSTPVADLPPWITYGPRWHTAVGRWGTTDEALCELVLPAEFHDDLDAHPLHAALLDAATAQLAHAEPGVELVPWMHRRLTTFAPMRPRMLVVGRLGTADRSPRTLDCEFYDAETGEPLATIEQFTLRAQAAARMADSAPARESAREPAAGDGLLTPAQGAAAFLELLNGSYPPVVVVDAPGPLPQVSGVLRVGGEAPGEPIPPVAASVEPAPVVVNVPATAPAATPSVITDQLRVLWEQTLGIRDIKPTDDFFDLGGNSLSAVQLTARIGDRFGVELGAGAMFELSTIETMAAELAGQGAR